MVPFVPIFSDTLSYFESYLYNTPKPSHLIASIKYAVFKIFMIVRNLTTKPL